MITLSDEERRKFSAWLRQEIETDKLLIGQMEKLHVMGDIVAKRQKQVIAAKMIVAGILESTESQTIGGP